MKEITELLNAESLTEFAVLDLPLRSSDRDAAALRETNYETWLESGSIGTMEYLLSHRAAKYRPDRIASRASSVIICLLEYRNQENGKQNGRGYQPSGLGRISEYAYGRDYHKELGHRLKRIAKRLRERYPEDQFFSFTDATPLDERFFAERAGLGFIGRNGLLITKEYGSYVFIGEIISTRRFPQMLYRKVDGACPSTCRRCIEECPTGALREDGSIDARRCVSYLTIEHRGPIPEEFREKMGDWIFGCDECQSVCPFNRRFHRTNVPGFRQAIAGESVLLEEILRMKDHDELVKRFAGSPLMRAGRSRLVRNACIVAANSGLRHLTPLIGKLSDDPDPVVSEVARWAQIKLARW